MRLNQREREPMDALDRYWDALVAGETGDDDALDPALAAAVRELHARDDAPAPDPAFRARLGQRLAAEAAVRGGSDAVPLRADAPGGHDLLMIGPPAEADQPELAGPAQGGWRRWLREGAGMAAAAVVLVAVAGLLVVLLQGRGEGERTAPSAGPETTLPLVATDSGFTISLIGADLAGSALTLTFEVAADPQATPDLAVLDGLGPSLPPFTMRLSGLERDASQPGHVEPGTAQAQPFAGYRATVPVRLTGDATDEVRITITALRFDRHPGDEPQEVPGEWRFTFVPAEIAAEEAGPGLEVIEPALATLREAGLVFDIGQRFEVGGDAAWRSGEVTLDWLAVDRDVTYLGFTADPPELADVILLDERGFPLDELADGRLAAFRERDASGSPPSTRWIAFPGLDPATREVRVLLMPTADPSMVTPGTTAGQSVKTPVATIPVDLSPLADLPAPQPLRARATANGIDIDAVELRRGVAVSTLTLSAQVLDPSALIPADDLAVEHQILPPITATVDGVSVPVIGQSGPRGSAADAVPIRLANLPERGTLRLSIPWWWVKINENEREPLRGPWELTIDLETGASAVSPMPNAPVPGGGD
ncbi:MAG: hypothetical protein QJR03_10475 [Sphaerobacter sp.]|nr:hypothetical protein [Sphaerobacter sp.]